MFNTVHYNNNRGIFSPVMLDRGRVIGYWLEGNNYRAKVKYYGTYPPSYLKRMALLFPPAVEYAAPGTTDNIDVLHLFSGVVERDINRWPNETMIDINPDLKPTICGDVLEILPKLPEAHYDLALGDPPYGRTMRSTVQNP